MASTTRLLSLAGRRSTHAVRPVLARASTPLAASATHAARLYSGVPSMGVQTNTTVYKWTTQTSQNMVAQRFYSSGPVDVVIPALGDSISEGELGSWSVAEGDYVEQDQVLCVVETDKINADIRAPEAGIVGKLLFEEGDTVDIGATVTQVTPGEKPAGSEAPKAEAPKAEAPKEEAKPAAPKKADTPKPAAKQQEAPKPAAASPGRQTRVAMSRMRKRIAERLKDSQNTAAMLTTFNEIDMYELMNMRNQYKDLFFEKHGVKLGFMSAFVKASTAALKAEPAVNAFLEGDEIVYSDFVDISVAVATPKGLVTPVLRDCDRMSFADVEKEIAELGKKARAGGITLADLSGGTFTISNGGVYGSMMGTPIINPPQSAILGMHGIVKRPTVVNDKIEIRPIMYVALTYDHRLIDGREAVTALKTIKENIEDPRRLLLEL